MGKSRSGFTIVELLIVIVVIGILAAITVVAFSTVRGRAFDASVQTDIKELAKRVRAYQVETGSLPIDGTQFSTMNLRFNKNAYDHYFNGTSEYNIVYCYRPSVAPTDYAIVAFGKGKHYKYDAGGRLSEFTLGKTGSVTACADAGVPLDVASDRYWFYDNNAWRSYL